MKIDPREYQLEAIDATISHFDRGIFSVIDHLPTGTGKSLVQQELVARHFPIERFRTLLIGGISRQLNFQAERGFRQQYPECQSKIQKGKFLYPGIGLVMGDLNNADARIVIGSAQTLVDKAEIQEVDAPENQVITAQDFVWTEHGGVALAQSSKRPYLVSPRMDQILFYGLIDLWIHDEAHHAPADGTLLIMTRLNELYKAAKVTPLKNAGFTATPVRADERALSNVYQKIAFSRSYKWAQEMGFLAPFPPENVHRVEIEGLNTRTNSRGGKHKAKDVSNWAKMIVKAYKDIGENRPAIAFTGTMGEEGGVENSKTLAREFNKAGIPAIHVDGECWIDTDGTIHPNSTRHVMFQRVMNGEIKIMCNFGVLTEGVDIPIISLILLARRVNEVLFTQIMGRAFRLFQGNAAKGIPAKVDAKLIDFTGQELVMLATGTLLGMKLDPKTLKPMPDQKIDEEEILSGSDTRDLHRKRGHVLGENNVYSIAKIRQKSKGAWYDDPQRATMSIAVSKNDMLFIHPPHYGTADRAAVLLEQMDGLRERTQPDIWRKVTDTLDYTRRIFSTFSLWHIVRGEFETSLKIPGYILVNGALDVLEADAMNYAREHCNVADYIMEKKSWQRQNIPPTPPQMEKLRQVMPEGYKLPKNLTKGEASHLITHLMAEKSVMKAINPLLDHLTKLEAKLVNPVNS